MSKHIAGQRQTYRVPYNDPTITLPHSNNICKFWVSDKSENLLIWDYEIVEKFISVQFFRYKLECELVRFARDLPLKTIFRAESIARV